jgi:hypothetical protein
MNPIALEMVARARQMEIERQRAMQHMLERADKEYREWATGRLALAVLSLVFPVSLLGIFILA